MLEPWGQFAVSSLFDGHQESPLFSDKVSLMTVTVARGFFFLIPSPLAGRGIMDIRPSIYVEIATLPLRAVLALAACQPGDDREDEILFTETRLEFPTVPYLMIEAA